MWHGADQRVNGGPCLCACAALSNKHATFASPAAAHTPPLLRVLRVAMPTPLSVPLACPKTTRTTLCLSCRSGCASGCCFRGTFASPSSPLGPPRHCMMMHHHDGYSFTHSHAPDPLPSTTTAQADRPTGTQHLEESCTGSSSGKRSRQRLQQVAAAAAAHHGRPGAMPLPHCRRRGWGLLHGLDRGRGLALL